MSVKGQNGQIELYNDRIRILRKGFLALLTQGLKGDKDIFLSSITGIQLKKPGFTRGYFQVVLSGSDESKGGVRDAEKDENSVMIVHGQHPEFEKLRDAIYALRSGRSFDFTTARPIQSFSGQDAVENAFTIALLLLCCFPVGLYLVWNHPRWDTQTKGIWTGIWALLFSVGMLTSNRDSTPTVRDRESITKVEPKKSRKSSFDNANATVNVRNGVRDRMHNPSSSSFPWGAFDFQPTINGYRTTSYAEGKNAFGATVRIHFTAEVSESGRVISLDIH